jgi:hypothetical protein
MPLKLCFISFGNALIVVFHHTMELEFYTFLNIISKYVKSQNYYENLLGKVC